MNRRMDSVRSRYAYICGASALLSAALLFVMAQTFEFIYRHVLVGDGSLSRIVHWVINHIGRTPFLFVGGAVLFMLFFGFVPRRLAPIWSKLPGARTIWRTAGCPRRSK